MKLNGTHQLLVYGDNVNILGGSVRTVKENAEALIMPSKETGLELTADKTKYMVMCREQTAARSHRIQTDNSSSEREGQLKYLGTTFTDQNPIQEEIKSKKCLLSFDAESFVFQVATQKHKK